VNPPVILRFFNRSVGFFDLPEEFDPTISFLSLNQVHGSDVLVLDRRPQGTETNMKEPYDGVVTLLSEIALTIHTADCLPLLAHGDGVIGACHAGWRGLSQNIVENWIGKMGTLGARKENLKVFIGPSIGPCHFEVTREVGAKIVSSKEFPVKFLGSLRRDHPDPNKEFIDLRAVARFKLSRLGIQTHNMQISEECTYCRPNLYYSYRRDGARPGRLEAVIVKSRD